MINKYIAMGYMSADPKFVEFDSGKKKSEFSLGISSNKETLWIDVVCWDKIAENCKKYLAKGSLVFVEGKLKYNSWKDKNGNSRNKIICVCDFLKIINSKKSNSEMVSNQEMQKISERDPSKESNIEKDLELQKDLEDCPW